MNVRIQRQLMIQILRHPHLVQNRGRRHSSCPPSDRRSALRPAHSPPARPTAARGYTPSPKRPPPPCASSCQPTASIPQSPRSLAGPDCSHCIHNFPLLLGPLFLLLLVLLHCLAALQALMSFFVHLLFIGRPCEPIRQRRLHCHRLYPRHRSSRRRRLCGRALLAQSSCAALAPGATGNPRCAINSIARSIGIRTVPAPLSM